MRTLPHRKHTMMKKKHHNSPKPLTVFLSALIVLLCLNGCRKQTPKQPTADSTTQMEQTQEQTPTPVILSRKLSDFTLIRQTGAPQSIVRAVQELNQVIQELTGESHTILTDRNIDRKETPNEILIGCTSLEASQSLNSLGRGDFVIRTVVNENGISLVVGGATDDATVQAIYELTELLQSYAADNGSGMEIPDLNIESNIRELVLEEDILQKLVVLYPADANATLITAVESIQAALSSATGKPSEAIAISSLDEAEQYPDAIVLGGASEEGKAKQDAMFARAFSVSIEQTEAGTRIYLVGYMNESGTDDFTKSLYTLRAAQYFYSKSVVNGQFAIPKYLNATVSTFFQRDPCIVVYEGMYYLYFSTGSGFAVKSSKDLINWSTQRVIFSASNTTGFDGDGDYWAPECHIYNGEFYLFATYHSKVTGHRGCAVFRSSAPMESFELISKQSADATTVGHITPSDWDAIDGTLYLDQEGKPWMVFVYEWTSTEDGIGRMAYAPLSDDLSYFTSDPVIMFGARDAKWATGNITDGCWMYRCQDGTLLMIWSNLSACGYTVGLAKSSNGELDGTWTQLDPLFIGDQSNIYVTTEGGHGCIFTDLDGRLNLAIHAPNSGDDIAMAIIPIVEDGGTLRADTIQSP